MSGRREDSEQELADKVSRVMDTSTKSDIPLARRPPQTVTLPAPELARMRKNVEDWSNDPDLLKRYLQKQTYLHLQIIDYMIENPPAGRSTPQNMIAAASRFSEMANALLERLQDGRKPANAGEESPMGRSNQRSRALAGKSHSGGEET